MDIVRVLVVYKSTVALSSVIILIQLSMAPEMIPDRIMGTVIRTNVRAGDAPKLIAASSTLTLVLRKVASAERTVYEIGRAHV